EADRWFSTRRTRARPGPGRSRSLCVSAPRVPAAPDVAGTHRMSHLGALISMKRTNALQFWRAALIGLGVVTLLGGSAAHAQRIVRDRYIRILVDDASGNFTIQNLDGDPLNVNDDNLNALFSD